MLLKARIAVVAVVPMIALAACGFAGLGSPTASQVLVGYLRDLVSRNYSAAYAATTLSLSMTERSSPTNPSTAALSRAHFAAFEAGDPILSFRVVRSYGRQIQVEIHRKGGVSTEDLWLNGNRVQIGVQVATLDVGGGPLPSLFVDGVLAKVTPRPQRVVTLLGDTGRFDNQYVFAVIDGKHSISAPEGFATAAFRNQIGPTDFDLPIALKPSARVIRSAHSILAGWADSCGSACPLNVCYAWPTFFPLPWLVDGASFHPTGYRVVSRGRTERSIVMEGTARSGSRTVTGRLVMNVLPSGVLRLAAACLGA